VKIIKKEKKCFTGSHVYLLEWLCIFVGVVTCVNSCRPHDRDVPPDVEVILEDVDDPHPQALARLRVLRHDPVEDEVVLLVLFKFVHLFLRAGNQNLYNSLKLRQ